MKMYGIMKDLGTLILAATLFTSCTQNAAVDPLVSAGTAVSSANVPAAVTSSFQTLFPSARNVVWSMPSPTTYQATYTTTTSANGRTAAGSKARKSNFSKSGRFKCTYGVIDPATLPATITTYLTTTYPAGYTITSAASRTDATTGAVSGYMVDIMSGGLYYELRFTAAGAFLSVENEDGSDEGVAVAQTNLPAPIGTYLTANYVGYTFHKARSYMLNGVVTGYEVEIRVAGLEYDVVFGASGNFISVRAEGSDKEGHDDDHGSSTAVTQASLPVPIGTYLTANYAGYVFQGAYSYSQNGVLTGYEVTMLLNGVYTELMFNTAGTFVSVHAAEKGDGDHDGGDDDHKGNGNHSGSTDAVIAQASLPATITTFLTTNYAGYVFVSAKVEQNGTVVTGYEVNFTMTGKRYEAEFDATGKLIKLH